MNKREGTEKSSEGGADVLLLLLWLSSFVEQMIVKKKKGWGHCWMCWWMACNAIINISDVSWICLFVGLMSANYSCGCFFCATHHTAFL
uniref:Ovule protein n=1 Tax=Syphacia muris TaxID=451379 RepID=A0A0N5ADK1_9BILA